MWAHENAYVLEVAAALLVIALINAHSHPHRGCLGTEAKMKDENSSGRTRLGRTLKAGMLCSFTLLAAPAATTCGAAPDTYCPVNTILKAKCQTCHSNTPNATGAPENLVTYADTQAASKEIPSLKVWQQMQTKVDNHLMPPPPSPPNPAALTAAEISTFDAWFAAGAPAPPAACP
jgi:uncharacterized membrane protein